jgi:hypothetical protein
LHPPCRRVQLQSGRATCAAFFEASCSNMSARGRILQPAGMPTGSAAPGSFTIRSPLSVFGFQLCPTGTAPTRSAAARDRPARPGRLAPPEG